MSEPKQTKKRSPLRRFLKAVFRTVCILVFLLVFAFLAALFTIDRWIVPFGAWCAGVEVEGEPDVMVSIPDREILVVGLKMKSPAGEIEAKSFGLRLDGVELSGRALKEIRVSNVHADGLRVSLDFARLAGKQNEQGAGGGGEADSGEKVRTFSHLIWDRASKPVVRMMDLSLLDAEVCWWSGAAQSVISISDLEAEFEDGRLTRPQMICGVKYSLSEPWRSIQAGTRLKASASRGGEGVIVSATGNGPLVIELPETRLEFPAMESTDMIVQYEPESDSVRFGGEWTDSDRWEYKPLDMSLDNALLEVFGTLALDGEKLRLRFGATAQGSDIVCRDNAIPGDVALEAKCNVDFDLVTGGVTLDSLSGRLSGPDGGQIDLQTSGVFEFVRHEDATYTLEPQAARLSLSTGKPLNLTRFDPVLPFNAVGRELTADYYIELDPEEVRLLGGAKATVRNRETGFREFDADAGFETDGVNRIGSFHVSHCGVSFFDGDDRICQALLTGEYNIRTASLQGNLTYYPYRMIETFGDSDLAGLCVFLDDAHLRGAEHAAAAELELDLVNMSAKLHKESHLSHLALTGTDGNNLELDAIGDADFRLDPDGQGWQLECGLDLKAGTEFHAVLNANGSSENAITGRLEIDRLGDALVRQMEHKFFPGRDDLPVLRFLNAAISADFRCDPENSRIVLSGVDAALDNGEGRAELHSKTDFAWENGAFVRVPADFTLKTNSLPVSFWEPLFGDEEAFRPVGGVMSSELDISVSTDGSVVNGDGKLVCTDLTILLDGKPREMARLGANGYFLVNRKERIHHAGGRYLHDLR